MFPAVAEEDNEVEVFDSTFLTLPKSIGFPNLSYSRIREEERIVRITDLRRLGKKVICF